VLHKGVVDVDYKVGWSGLHKPSQGLALEKIQISAGKYITVSGTFALSPTERALHMVEDEYMSRLEEIGNRFIVLHDIEVRKAWLVDGLSALLHLIRSNLTYDHRNNTYGTATSLSDPKTILAKSNHSGRTMAFETLIDSSNMKTRLYRKPGIVSKEGKAEEDSDFYCMVDAVKYIMHVLEQIADQQADTRTESSVGYRIQKSPWKQMQGYDFMDIATKSNQIWSRATELEGDGEGWVGLTRAVHATTLFGKGFGELLEPVREIGDQNHCVKCYWNSNVPTQRDILAVPISELDRMTERRGSKSDTSWRLVDKFHLDLSTELFSVCLKNKRGGCRQQRVQRLQYGAIRNREQKPKEQKKKPSHVSRFLTWISSRRNKSVSVGENTPSLDFSTGGVLLGMPPKGQKKRKELEDKEQVFTRRKNLSGAEVSASLDVVAESSRSRTVAQNTNTTARLNSGSTPLTELSRSQDPTSSVAIKNHQLPR